MNITEGATGILLSGAHENLITRNKRIQQEDCSICYFNFGPTGDPPLSNLKQPPTSADMPVLNSPLLSFIYLHHIPYIKNIARGTTDPGY